MTSVDAPQHLATLFDQTTACEVSPAFPSCMRYAVLWSVVHVRGMCERQKYRTIRTIWSLLLSAFKLCVPNLSTI